MTDEEIRAAIALEKKRYHKQWRDKNKDKIKQYNKNYWEKKALERAAEGGANE